MAKVLYFKYEVIFFKCPLGYLDDSVEFGTLGKRLTDLQNNIINLFVSACVTIIITITKYFSSAAML